jgi:predicted SAM-dependent methyltransferase
MKIHLCCGDVYLRGYVNIDKLGVVGTCEGTTIDDYYTKPINTDSGQGSIIVDKVMDITERWDFADESVEEIVMICGIEHFTKLQGEHILREAHRVLIKGGKLLLDFPDIVNTVRNHEGTHYMIRLLYGSGKNIESVHKWGYTKFTIGWLLKDWSSVEYKDIVMHEYPMIGVEATK